MKKFAMLIALGLGLFIGCEQAKDAKKTDAPKKDTAAPTAKADTKTDAPAAPKADAPADKK